MSNLAIKAENISKLYRLGDVGTGTLSNDLTRFWAKLRGKEDPFSKIAVSNNRSQKANSDYVWSLRDIDFEIKKGDAVGIIGRNGAGKSTLLKILSRITSPTIGRVRIDGRVASLLEVGTGFSPELTGRQNIYMNGAILGMTRAEITSKLDEIVDFSGCEAYIDTPVKRYSSGMYVRLAFAVAAHLEPEILIVDEVLAVGDAEFQKKCLGKMQDVNSKDGRTVLFVSHNIASIKALCNKGLVLANGRMSLDGDIDNAIEYYQNSFSTTQQRTNIVLEDNVKDAQVKSVRLLSPIEDKFEFDVFDELWLEVRYLVRKKIVGCTPILFLKKNGLDYVWSFASDLDEAIIEGIEPGDYTYKLKLPSPLKKGVYSCSLAMGKLRVGDIDKVEDAIVFSIEDYSFDPTNKSYAGSRPAAVPAIIKWEL